MRRRRSSDCRCANRYTSEKISDRHPVGPVQPSGHPRRIIDVGPSHRPENKARLAAEVPMGRLGLSEELANAPDSAAYGATKVPDLVRAAVR
jgi:hypothetical protein